MTERTVTIALRSRVASFNQGLAQAGAEVERTGKKVEGFSQRNSAAMTKAGMAAVAFGGATAFALNKAANASNELNAEMANIATLIPNQTARVYELRDSVQELAVDVGKSTTDISGGLYQVVSAFGDTADTAEILRINAKGATAGLATTTDAIALTSATTKGYGDTSAEAVQHASDLALMTVRMGQTTFPELAASVGRVIPLAASLSVTQEELFAVMTTGTGVTGTAAEVSTQLRGVLQSLMAPTADMTGLLEEHGYASGEAALADLGLQGAIEMVVKAAEDSGVPLQKYMSSIEGQTLAMALAGPQAETLTENMEAMGRAAGTTEEAFAEMTEGIGRWAFDAQQAAVQQEVAMQKLGEAVAPVKATLTGFLGDAAEGFSSLSPEMQEAAAKAGMVASAVGILGGAALIAAPRLATMNATLAATGPLGLAASRGITMATGALLGPWGIAAATATTAGLSLHKAFRTARDSADELAREILATSATTEEAAARIDAALGEHMDEVGSAGRKWTEAKNLLLGPVGAFFNLRDGIGDATTAWHLWRTEVHEMPKAMGEATYAATQFTPAAGQAAQITDELRQAAAAAGIDIDELTGGVAQATSAFDDLAPSIEASFLAYAAGFDPMPTYQEAAP